MNEPALTRAIRLDTFPPAGRECPLKRIYRTEAASPAKFLTVIFFTSPEHFARRIPSSSQPPRSSDPPELLRGTMEEEGGGREGITTVDKSSRGNVLSHREASLF
jgi:hypothetical protein